MSSTLENVSAELQPAELKKPNIPKAFNLLKTHAAAVANFTLLWQDLEDHFLSIRGSIESKLQQLQPKQDQLAPTLQSQATALPTDVNPTLVSPTKSLKTQIDSKETPLVPTVHSQAKTEETELSPTLQCQAKFNATENQSTATLQSQDKCKEPLFTSKKTPLVPTIQSQIDSKKTQLSPTLTTRENSKETQFKTIQHRVKSEESLPENASFNGMPLYDGKALLLYLNEGLKEQESMRNDVYNALKVSVDCGKLVVDAVKWYNFCESKEDMNAGIAVARRSCVLLLEELMRVRSLIKEEVKEDAMKLALEWKAKIRVGVKNSFEVYGFLLLLGAFELTDEFNEDEVLTLFDSVLQRKQAPELFRALGFADRASDFIQKVISQNRLPDALRFVYAYELVDKFPPVPLLKEHLKQAKKFRKMSCKGKKSIKTQDEATNKEIATIKAVIRCIDSYQLASQYSPEILKNRILQLRKHIKEMKAAATASGPKDQLQQQNANKRTAPEWIAQSNHQHGNKHPRRDAAHASVNEAFSTHSAQKSYHLPEGFLLDQGAEFSGMASGASIPNVRVGAALSIHSRQPTHHHQQSSFYDQDPYYYTPSAGQYSLARSSPSPPLSSLSATPYGLLRAGSITQHRNLTTGPYELMGSTSVAQHMNSTAGHYGTFGSQPGMSSSSLQYGRAMALNRSTGQVASAGSHAEVAIAPNSSPGRPLSYYLGQPRRIPDYYDMSFS